MPKRKTPHVAGTRKYLHNCSFELLCAGWFSQAGWQVFLPCFDHGHRTDLLVSDGPNYYRVQIKTTEKASDKFEISNLWNGSNVHYVALFAKNSTWGIIFPAFAEKTRTVKETQGEKFERNATSFMKAFHALA